MVVDFYKKVENKDNLGADDLNFLADLLARYPYFIAARKLYLKSLQNSGNIHFQSELSKSVVFMSDKSSFFFYLYPGMRIDHSTTLSRKDKFTGSYFDLLDLPGSEKENSLKLLAEKLKKARNNLTELKKNEVLVPTTPKVSVPVVDYFKFEVPEPANSEQENEELVKELIKNKKYAEAIESLKRLNLNNPKKSVYFADQIRFLEKVIQYQHN